MGVDIDRNGLTEQIVEQNMSLFLESLCGAIPGGVCIFELGKHVRLIDCNDKMISIFGYSKEKLTRFDMSKVYSCIYEDDCEVVLQAIYQENKGRDFGEIRVRIKCGDGRLVWTRVSLCRLTGELSDYACVVCIPIAEHEDTIEAMQNKIRALQYKVDMDSLTGIYSRERFCEETEKLLLRKRQEDPDNAHFAIVVFDIDHFRIVNEVHGNKAGDRVLIHVARAIAFSTKGHGTFGRLGSDRFCVCISEELLFGNMDMLERFLSGENDISVENSNSVIAMHAGIYPIEDESMSVNLMCDRATLAVRSIKNNYTRRWICYDEKDSAFTEDQGLLNDMVPALENHEFFVMYQPIVDSATQKIVSAEALVRWKHPVKGMISPGVFIPLFEKNGFITKLDHYVCEEVCRFLAWQKENGIEMVPISVNLSRMNFYNSALCAHICELTHRYDVDPWYLKLEITESAYQTNQSELLYAVKNFRDNGFRVMMDDFGSGYSSLNMLKDVLVDVLKIDMKFMDDIEQSHRANNILYSIVQMAKSLNIEIVVEGVETQGQYQLVRNMGCDCIQGYYFYRPMASENYIENLQENVKNGESVQGIVGTRILILHEDKQVLTEVKSSLDASYQYVYESDAEAALDYLKRNSNSIDLVISSMELERESGVAFVAQMQLYKNLAVIPVLMMTTGAKREKIHQALRNGAIDIVMNPIDPVLFRHCVENILKISANDSIKDEVSRLRERVSLNQEIMSIISQQNIGMCRFRLERINAEETLELLCIDELLFTTEWYEYMHHITDENCADIHHVIDLLDNMTARQQELLCNWLGGMVREKKESGQYMYEVYLEDESEPSKILLSIRGKYQDDKAVIDIIEELYEVPDV